MKFSLLINIEMTIVVHAQLCLARINLQPLVICDLLAGQISWSAELCMKKKVLLSRGQVM